MRQTKDGLPGLRPRQLLEILLPFYGLKDSLKRWLGKLTSVLKELGWAASVLDESVDRFHDADTEELASALCIHVDGAFMGGNGATYRSSVNALWAELSFRQWKRGYAAFSGSLIVQDVLAKRLKL